MQDCKTFEIKAETVEKVKEERAIVHYISTSDKDWGGDIVNPKGMDDSEYSKSPTVFYNHKYDLPIAKSLWRKVDDKGVLAKTQFSKKSLFADDIYGLHEEGIINTWSIGWQPKMENGRVKKGALEYDDEKGILHINEWDLVEYSSAPLAMNPNALDQIKTMVKSIEAKNIVKDMEAIVDVKKSIEEQKEELKKVLDLINEMKGFIDNLDFKSYDERLNEFEKELIEQKKTFINKIKNTLETSGDVRERAKKMVAGEVRRLIQK